MGSLTTPAVDVATRNITRVLSTTSHHTANHSVSSHTANYSSAANFVSSHHLPTNLSSVTLMSAGLGSSGTSSSVYSTRVSQVSTWTVEELRVLGVILWIVILFTLIGNLACFYAVFKNIKALLQHPFFQSNMFCVYLSLVDVLQVLLVGVPAALSYTSSHSALDDGFYNRVYVNPILDFVVWLQLLLVVAICVDRAGHICRPLRYTYNITACKTGAILALCTAIPFLTLTLPYILNVSSVMNYWRPRVEAAGGDFSSIATLAFFCENARSFDAHGLPAEDRTIFLTCVLHSNQHTWEGSQVFQMWMNVANPLVMFLAVTALVATSVIIIYKLTRSARLQRDNAKRQDEVARGIRLTCTVSFFQALLILVSTLPLRWYQIDERLFATDERYKLYSGYYKVIARTMVFLGPIFNPWLYPIRMASIRSFLIKRKKKLASSVTTNLTKIKTSLNLTDRSNAVNTKLLSADTRTGSIDKNESTAV